LAIAADARCALATALAAAGVLGALSSAGCQDQVWCESFPPTSQVTLTVHLPPEQDVAMPETVKVCQDFTGCTMATVPPLGTSVAAGFEFPPPVFKRGPEVVTFPVAISGDLSIDAGGVRLLEILWPLVKGITFNPNDSPSQGKYSVDVSDANGVPTGKLVSTIIYTHVTRCAGDGWVGAASD
jgi:hypothetical protein